MKINISWIILLLVWILGLYFSYKYILWAYNGLNTTNNICDTILYGSVIILFTINIFSYIIDSPIRITAV
jgi:hypothetical protein